MSHRILILDCYYPDFLKSWVMAAESDYETELQRLLHFSFGTSDFYSCNLKALGWETCDVIANYLRLQRMWVDEHDLNTNDLESIAFYQIEEFNPNIVLLQDLSFFSNSSIEILKSRGIVLAAQCSCQMPYIDKVEAMDCIFTSFPHYLKRFKDLGVKAVYLPLAFEPDVLNRLSPEQPERDLDCVFVGGMGWQWKESLPLLETLAREIPSMQFWGYGYETLPAGSPICEKHQGPAWGLDMYRILRRAKIVVNRHGAVSGPYANNLRLFEATGCGALLLTDWKKNMEDFFGWNEVATYREPKDAVAFIRSYLDDWGKDLQLMSSRGQVRTLCDHTYAQRMPIVSEALKECLKSRTVA